LQEEPAGRNGLFLRHIADRIFQRVGHFTQSRPDDTDGMPIREIEFGVEMDDVNSRGLQAGFSHEGSQQRLVII
jgi:hypothetical protein